MGHSSVTWKVRMTAKFRNRYNQVPHLSQDTKWESNKIRINITNKNQGVGPFPSGDNKAAMNRTLTCATYVSVNKMQYDMFLKKCQSCTNTMNISNGVNMSF